MQHVQGFTYLAPIFSIFFHIHTPKYMGTPYFSCPRCDLLLQLCSRGKCILRIAFHCRQRLFLPPSVAPPPLQHPSPTVGEVWSRFHTQTHACLWPLAHVWYAHCAPHTSSNTNIQVFCGVCLTIWGCLPLEHFRLGKQNARYFT